MVGFRPQFARRILFLRLLPFLFLWVRNHFWCRDFKSTWHFQDRLFLCFLRSIFFRFFAIILTFVFLIFAKNFIFQFSSRLQSYSTPQTKSRFSKKDFIMANYLPQMNIHEVVFHTFITKDCPTFMADKLINLFRVTMMVFNGGSVNYNAVMICNTLMVDFFMRNHRILARGLALEFVDKVLFRLVDNDKFWRFLNTCNVHLFYLNYRTKMMNVICSQLARMYGHENFQAIFSRLTPGIRGREDMGNFYKLP